MCILCSKYSLDKFGWKLWHGQLDKQWFLSVNDCIYNFLLFSWTFFWCNEKREIWTNICHQIFIFGQYNADIRPQILKNGPHECV